MSAAPCGIRFVDFDRGTRVTDAEGRTWSAREDALVAGDGELRLRLATHRAFWFGWHAAHPDTRLVGVEDAGPAGSISTND